jgi:hypothetical protein
MEKLDAAIIEGVTSDRLQEIAIDGAEVALDSFLAEGVLREIPIVGTIYKISKAAWGIKDAIFAKAVYKFLFELKDIPLEKRKAFIEKISSNPEYDTKVGEKIIVILDKLDDLDKATIIGRLLKYTIEEKIEYSDFLRMSSIIQRAFLPDLMFLKVHRHVDSYSPEIREHILTLGLVRMAVIDDYAFKKIKDMSVLGGGSTDTPFKIQFELNRVGEKMRSFLLDCFQ